MPRLVEHCAELGGGGRALTIRRGLGLRAASDVRVKVTAEVVTCGGLVAIGHSQFHTIIYLRFTIILTPRSFIRCVS